MRVACSGVGGAGTGGNGSSMRWGCCAWGCWYRPEVGEQGGRGSPGWEGGSAVCSPPFELKACAITLAKGELQFLGVFVMLQCFAPTVKPLVSPGNPQLNSPKAVRA